MSIRIQLKTFCLLQGQLQIKLTPKIVAEDPNVLIPRRPHELQLSYGTLLRILHLEKVQLTQQLKSADHAHVVDTWNGCLNIRTWTAIFR